MQTIENDILKITIDEKGALLKSIIFKPLNKEIQYQIEPDSWQFQDVVIFPLIGAGEYEYETQKFTFPTRHGFLRNNVLKIESINEHSITLSLESNKDTYQIYPFKFKFFINYQVINNELIVTTKIENKDNKDLYFSYGSHTALKANSEIGVIEFDKDYKFLPLNCGLIDANNEDNIYMNIVNLKKSNFQKLDTLVYEGSNEKLTLYTGLDELKIIYEFNAPYFAIWSNAKKGEYVCIEPWWGISNYIEESKTLDKRLKINKLKENEATSFSYKLTFKIN